MYVVDTFSDKTQNNKQEKRYIYPCTKHLLELMQK